jgi:hypothetical protein
LQPYLHGEPVPKTRTFEEREPPFRALMTLLCAAVWKPRNGPCGRY